MRLNMIIATAAVFISFASFYVAYLQAEAEERQVKALTWPFLQITHGNFDTESNQSVITYRLQNAGVGPAMLRNFTLIYRDTEAGMFSSDILEACCLPEGREIEWFYTDAADDIRGDLITSAMEPQILPPRNSTVIFSLKRTEANGEFWDLLNDARQIMVARGCYCSLLDECYLTDFRRDPVVVDQCPDASGFRE